MTASSLRTGTTLGPYEIVAPLGAGAMGEVYRARDTRLGRDVALKVILAEHARDPERIARFEQEARAAGALSHANVCAVYDIGTHEASPFVVMELLEGESLRSVIERGPLPPRHALDFAAQIAEGLSAAHAKGIVHRDLKPENVFVTPEGRVKVLDFGVAKLMHAARAGDSERTIATSEAGALFGTSAYMAPEQASGANVDARADVFALGIVLFEMLSSRRPFTGTTPIAMMHAILHEEPAQLPDAPVELARIVRRCLAKDPERRIQTAKDVRNDLHDLARELERGVPAAERARNRLVEKRVVLTAANVRELSERNPRLVGYPMTYLDNGVDSDTLVVALHGVGGHESRWEPYLSVATSHAVAPTLVGFGREETHRPALGVDDHSRLLRILLKALVQQHRPRTMILLGHSAGGDQFLRMVQDHEGAGIDVDGLLVTGPNISMETCWASKRYAGLDPANPAGTLAVLKELTANIDTLSTWLLVHSYLLQTFTKFGSDLEPLRRYASDIVAPFEVPGDPLADWYRAAKKKIPQVRIVLSNEEAPAGEALLARHLEHNVLGDDFTEDSFVIEPVHHMGLLEPGLLARHVDDLIARARSHG